MNAAPWKLIAGTAIIFALIASMAMFAMLVLGYFILQIPSSWSQSASAKVLTVLEQSAIMAGMIGLPCALFAGIVLALATHLAGVPRVWAFSLVGCLMCVLALSVIGSAVVDYPSVWGTALVLFSFVPVFATWPILRWMGFIK